MKQLQNHKSQKNRGLGIAVNGQQANLSQCSQKQNNIMKSVPPSRGNGVSNREYDQTKGGSMTDNVGGPRQQSQGATAAQYNQTSTSQNGLKRQNSFVKQNQNHKKSSNIDEQYLPNQSSHQLKQKESSYKQGENINSQSNNNFQQIQNQQQPSNPLQNQVIVQAQTEFIDQSVVSTQTGSKIQRTVYIPNRNLTSQAVPMRRRDVSGASRTLANLSIQGAAPANGLPPQSQSGFQKKVGAISNMQNMPPTQSGQNTSLSLNVGGKSNIKQRPKSSAPNSKYNHKNVNYMAEQLNNMKINTNQTNYKEKQRNGSQTRGETTININEPPNATHQGVHSVLNSMGQKLSINLPNNGDTQTHKQVPQSAEYRKVDMSDIRQQGIQASEGRKTKPISTAQLMNPGINSFMVPPNEPMRLQHPSTNEGPVRQIASDSTTNAAQQQLLQNSFFQKRNKSRGAISGQQVSSTTVTGPPSGTLQPGSRGNSLNLNGSPQAKHLTMSMQKQQNHKAYLIGPPNEMTMNNSELLAASIQQEQRRSSYQNQMMAQYNNQFNSTSNSQHIQKGMNMNFQSTTSQNESINGSIQSRQQQLMQGKLPPNQAQQSMNSRYQNRGLEQSLVIDPTDDGKIAQSFDKRNNPLQAVSSTTASGSGGNQNQLQNSDFKNKENLTQKIHSRKINYNQLVMHSMNSVGIEQNSTDSHGSAGTQNQNKITLTHPTSSKNINYNKQNHIQTLQSLTNLQTPNELKQDVNAEKNMSNSMPHSHKQISAKHAQIQQMQQDNLEMHLLPSTNKFYKRTYRHFFKRRMNQMERPLIIITFQGVIGDFLKDSGISKNQEHLLSRQYVNNIQNQMQGLPSGMTEEFHKSNLWVRIGTIDGLKYLSKHFQICIFNRDSCFEDHGKNFSQIQIIQQYLQQNDIQVDAIYSTQSQIIDSEQKEKSILKAPYKQGDIWEDYKQIYMDFSFTSDQKIKERILFVNSYDADFNSRNEEIKFDPLGYFLIDAKSKPARPLVEGLPLSYETKEKEIDLSDKGMFQFNKNAQKEVQTKEMPLTILIPNPRSMYAQQISFASVAKTIMTLSFFGQKKSKLSLKDSPDSLQDYLANIKYLQEFDVKVQRDQCLLQYNAYKQQGYMKNQQSNYNSQITNNEQNYGRKGEGGNQKNPMQSTIHNFNTKDSQKNNNFDRHGSTNSFSHQQNRPRSSNSHGRILQNHQNGNQTKNSNFLSKDQQREDDNDSNNELDESQMMETMVIPLSDQFFQYISWVSAFDYVNDTQANRDILGLISVRSNLIWRYFIKMLKERSNIQSHRQQRVGELKILMEHLDWLQTDEGKHQRQKHILDIYDKLKRVQLNGNPLTNMMARNFKVFIKIHSEIKRKSRRELENFTEALLMDQKMAELEKQNLENRIMILGANKPNQFFNTHVRVFEKVPIQFSSTFQASNPGPQKIQQQHNQANIQANIISTKRNQAHYTSISSNENNNSVYEKSQQSVIDSSSIKPPHKGKQSQVMPPIGNNSIQYGKKKQSSNVVVPNPSSSNVTANYPNTNFQSNCTIQSSNRKLRSRGTNPNLVPSDGNNTRRSNNSTGIQEGQQYIQQNATKIVMNE